LQELQNFTTTAIVRAADDVKEILKL